MTRLAVFVTAVLIVSLAHAASDLVAQHAALESAYARQLADLAGRCDAAGDAELAGQIRAWAEPRDPRKLYLIALPESFPDRDNTAGVNTPADLKLAAEFRSAREAEATRLFELARGAIREERASLAYQIVLETLRENPDHANARRLLGYVRFENVWHTPFEVRKLREGEVWHPQFGWLNAANVARYTKGERLYNGRWVSAAEDARLRRDIRSGWRIETEHYAIRTNHSLAAGVALGARLERLYAAWQQTFVRFYASQQQVNQLFEGKGLPPADKSRHLVTYYRDRDEYRRHLKKEIPADFETTGIYLGRRRTAFFFAPEAAKGETGDDSTLYHEATHQLFSESRQVVANIGQDANFWIVEGIACYFESFAEHRGYYTLGGAGAQRLQDARFRALDDKFYLPLAELSQFGMLRLQQDPRIATLYSQAAGLTHFLIHYDAGRYRDALVAYLVAVYTGRDSPGTLAELCGVDDNQLDQQYREFLAALPSVDEPVADAIGK